MNDNYVPKLYVVAGPNGIGKTTVFKKILPIGVQYINTDLIAKEIRKQTHGLNIQDLPYKKLRSSRYELYVISGPSGTALSTLEKESLSFIKTTNTLKHGTLLMRWLQRLQL